MFDILLYLYDTYLLTDQMPDAEHLSRKLSAVGFESSAITEAINWLSGLEDLNDNPTAPLSSGTRIYSAEECRRIDAEGRGFLTFLESAGLMPAHGREWVIDQALALPDTDISASRIKWVALLAIWKLKGSGDVLWLEDLVRGDFAPDADADEAQSVYNPTLH